MDDEQADAGMGNAHQDHPALDDLLAYAAGSLGGSDVSQVTTHLAACGECAGVVARIHLVAETMRADAVTAPATEVLARAKSLFLEREPASPSPLFDRLEPVRRVLAELVFDSYGGLVPGLAGFRGSGDRHLTYVAEAVQIDLHVQAPQLRDGAWQIYGQVDAATPGDSVVDIVYAGEEFAVTRVRPDAQGMFALEAPAGHYDLLVRLPDVIHVLPGLSIG